MVALNREDVEERIERLRERYGPVEVDDDELDDPYRARPDDFRAFVADAREAGVSSGYVVVRRAPEQMPAPSASMPEGSAATAERALLVNDRADDGAWSLPGGSREPGETLEAAAEREVLEEAGIECSIEGIERLRHGVAIPRSPVEGVDADAVHALHAVFAGRYEGGEIAVQATELYGACWFAELPEEHHRLLEDVPI